MEIPVMIWAGVLPVVVFLVYIVWKDRKKEPVSQLLKAFLLGMATCIPAIFIEQGISAVLFGDSEPDSEDFFGNAVDAFFVASLTEELLKLLALWLVLRRNRYYDEHYDGIVYAVFVGLGFAMVENVGYLVGNASEGWVLVAFMRAFLSIPGHYAFAVLMGYFYSLYHFGGHKLHHRLLIFVAPFVAHGLYDTLVNPMPVIGYCSILIMLVLFYMMQRFCQKKLMGQIEKDKMEGRI